MKKKIAQINLMVTAEVKKSLKEKAEQMGLNLTGFIEKIALEDVVFLDKNFKKVAQLFKLSM